MRNLRQQLQLLLFAINNSIAELPGVEHITLQEVYEWLKDIQEELE